MSPSQEPEAATRTARPSTPPDVGAFVDALIDRLDQSMPAAAFYKEALRIMVEASGAVCGTLELQARGALIQSSHHGDDQAAKEWEPTLQNFLTDVLSDEGPSARLFEADGRDVQVGVFGVHLPTTASPRAGAVVIVAPCRDRAEADERLALLETLAYLTLRHGKQRDKKESAGPAASGGARQSLQRLAGYASPQELAFAITNNLRTKAACEQVAIARVNGRKLSIYAVSGLDEVKARNPGVQKIQGAMEECLDARRAIACQPGAVPPELGGSADWRLHRQWRQSTGGDAVASVPLSAGQRTIGVLSVRRGADQPFEAEEIEKYRDLVAPYLEGIDLIERANRGLATHAIARLRDWLRRPTSHGEWRRRTLLTALAVFGAWFAFGTLEHRISARAELVPRRVQQVASPFDGVLTRAPLVAGDSFEIGDLICAFDTRELELEAEHLRSELAIARLDEGRALAGGTPAEVQMGRAQRENWRAQLELVESKIARSEVRAEWPGVVVQGDLRHRIGDSITKGEPLVHLMASGDLRLELHVPERSVADLELGQAGSFTPRARPDERRPITIARIFPSPEAKEGEQVYRVEAQAALDAPWLRAGMEGFARVEVGRRPVWRIALGRVVRWLRLNYWL